MTPVYIETGDCVLHALIGRLGTEGIVPLMVVAPAILVGIKMAHSGRMPPLCAGCRRYLEALCSVNGVELVEMSAEQAEEVKRAMGSHFVDLSEIFAKALKGPPS